MALRLVGICFVIVFAGCNSIRTTVLDRSEAGCLTSKPIAGHLKGVPVMVKVPTHVEVKVFQREFWYQDNDSDRLVPIKNEIPTRYVNTDLKQTEQMFVVDPQRPAAGTGIYGFRFASGATSPQEGDLGKGYLRGIEYKSDDKTLTESAKLVNSIASFLLAPGAGAPGTLSSTQDLEFGQSVPIVSTDRLVSFRRFNINSPTIDADITTFLNEYLNNCQSCLEPPVY